MGAYDFTTYQTGTDASQAFRDAVEQAQYEYGHGGYTGTIAEKDGYKVVSDAPLTMDEAEALANQIMSDHDHPLQDKHGPAGAIPVLTGERQVTVTIPFTAASYRTTAEAAAAVLAQEGRLLPGEDVAYGITGVYETCPRTGRIRKGSLTVPLNGGPLEHRGWLFFGYASS
ncbi:hypothetical protein ACIRPK_23805 [Kitasatospora sp. NPDC101801]|uniref:hypothetical protein n=1 Tax=Kitasatospora sp. NPDC101801 TaxID=3364103 RepID=UPI00380DE87A